MLHQLHCKRIMCVFMHNTFLPLFAPSMSAVYNHEITSENPPSTPQGGHAMRSRLHIHRKQRKHVVGVKKRTICSLSFHIRTQRAGAADGLRAILSTACL